MSKNLSLLPRSPNSPDLNAMYMWIQDTSEELPGPYWVTPSPVSCRTCWTGVSPWTLAGACNTVTMYAVRMVRVLVNRLQSANINDPSVKLWPYWQVKKQRCNNTLTDDVIRFMIWFVFPFSKHEIKDKRFLINLSFLLLNMIGQYKVKLALIIILYWFKRINAF